MKAALQNKTRQVTPLDAGGRAPHPASGHPLPIRWGEGRREGAVALVITLIMIAVITFLAITFLALSRRERGQVTTQVDQTTARFAADTGLERAVAELQATFIASTNPFNFDVLVSTNFRNPFGYDPSGAVYDQRTNVNYEYRNDGNFGLSGNEAMDNLTHLLYNPRAPVFIVTNRLFPASNEFRYYLDL